MKGRTARAFNAFFLILGVALLVLLVARLDTEQVGRQMADAGWMLLLAFAAYVGTLVFSTLAWHQLIDPSASTARFPQLFGAFWAGHAINGITPGGGLGEVLKGTILGKRMEGEEIVASIVVYTYLTGILVVAFTALGPLLCLLLLDLPTAVIGVLVGLTAVMCAAMILVRVMLRRGLAAQIIRGLQKLPFIRIADPEALARRAEEVDRRVRRRRQLRPVAFAWAMVFLVVVRVLQALEVWVLLLALLPDRNPGWVLLLAMLAKSATQIIAWSTAFVPGRVGVLEGGSALLFKLIGLDPTTGLSMEILRRVRKVGGIAVGLVLGAVLEWRARREPDVPTPTGSHGAEP